MRLDKEVNELVTADIISQDIANNIQNYYRNKRSNSGTRLFVVFGILGGCLIGLGIILILAHNWDELSRSIKTIFAFSPLLAGQFICAYTLIKKSESIAWRESSAAFLFFAVGAAISLVSQIYNIPGNLSSFFMTWMLLCLPLIYLMRSSIVSLLYIAGITVYVCEMCYWPSTPTESYYYWMLLLLALPHYYTLYKKNPGSNFFIFHNWILPLSVVISLGTIAADNSSLMYIAYFSLFAVLYLIGYTPMMNGQSIKNNGYLVLGYMGTLILLLVLSFGWFWKDLLVAVFTYKDVITSPELITVVIIFSLAAALLFAQQKNKSFIKNHPVSIVFLAFIVTFLVGLYSEVSVLLINLIVVFIGIWTIWEGAKDNKLGILNLGLIIIMSLVACRFFDEDLSFVIRGVLFVLAGIAFFATNYWMLKKRKTIEKNQIS